MGDQLRSRGIDEAGPHLQDHQREDISGYTPSVELGKVGDPPTRHLGDLAIVLDILDHLLASDLLLAELPQEVPEAVLKGDGEAVRFGAHPVSDESVVRVVGLLLNGGRMKE